jgi:hypothetical protein
LIKRGEGLLLDDIGLFFQDSRNPEGSPRARNPIRAACMRFNGRLPDAVDALDTSAQQISYMHMHTQIRANVRDSLYVLRRR